jgi:hypothetical protein
MNTVIDAVTAGVVTFKEAAICGNDGSRILVANVPMEASAASTAICSAVEEVSCCDASAMASAVRSVI